MAKDKLLQIIDAIRDRIIADANTGTAQIDSTGSTDLIGFPVRFCDLLPDDSVPPAFPAVIFSVRRAGPKPDSVEQWNADILVGCIVSEPREHMLVREAWQFGSDVRRALSRFGKTFGTRGQGFKIGEMIPADGFLSEDRAAAMVALPLELDYTQEYC